MKQFYQIDKWKIILIVLLAIPFFAGQSTARPVKENEKQISITPPKSPGKTETYKFLLSSEHKGVEFLFNKEKNMWRCGEQISLRDVVKKLTLNIENLFITNGLIWNAPGTAKENNKREKKLKTFRSQNDKLYTQNTSQNIINKQMLQFRPPKLIFSHMTGYPGATADSLDFGKTRDFSYKNCYTPDEIDAARKLVKYHYDQRLKELAENASQYNTVEK